MQMANKLTLKTNNFEFSVEGSDVFVCEKLNEAAKTFVKTIEDSGILLLLQSNIPTSDTPTEIPEEVIVPIKELDYQSDRQENDISFGTTRNMAQRLDISGGNNSKKGRELVMIAAFKLTLEGREKFTTKDILAEMKTATGYYNDAMRGLLYRFIRILVKEDRLLEVDTNVYSMTARANDELSKRLG